MSVGDVARGVHEVDVQRRAVWRELGVGKERVEQRARKELKSGRGRRSVARAGW